MSNSNQNSMQKPCSLSQLFFVMSAFLTPSLILPAYAASNACSSQDIIQIKKEIKTYVAKQSALSSSVSISSLKCKKDYASAQVTPNSAVTDKATVFLHKVGSRWQVLSLGTDFDTQFLQQIPAGLY